MTLSRRELLKIAAVTASTVVAGGLAIDITRKTVHGAGISRTTGKEFEAIPSTCQNCYARCGITGYVDSGYLQKIGGNDLHPNSRGKTCAKGQAGVNIANDPERVLYPMKRTGKRGIRKYEKISWGEAKSEIARQMQKLHQDGHPEQFVFQTLRDITTQDLIRRFVYAFGSPNALVNNALVKENKRFAQEISWGEQMAINDVANCRYILNFGSNPYEAHVLRTSFAQRITEGRATTIAEGKVHYGAKLVSFDVRCSQTSGKSDEWHPIFPGTDGLVALAMANIIMSEGWYDEEFLSQWTNFPINELKAHLSQYTIRLASKESGVPEEDIRRIALEFSQSKPATTVSTGGVTKHANGFYNERCVMLLNAICGNIDVKGGYCLPRYYNFSQPSPIPGRPQIESPFFGPSGYETTHNVLNTVKEGKQKVGIYMTYQHNPAYANPDTETHREILMDEQLIPFYVAIDDHFSESAMLADIILPCSTYLERLEVDSPPSFEMVPFVSLRQPIVSPPGECKSVTEILIELADAVGGNMSKYFNFTVERYVNQQISEIKGLVDAGGLDYLRKYGVWYDESLEPTFKSYEEKGFPTPSGKFEIYSQQLADLGFNPLPIYDPIPEHGGLSEDVNILTTFQWNVHTHFNTANCMLLSEIVHSNPVWINTKTAREKGIENGDLVEISSGTGTIETIAFVTEGIHPKVIAISDSLGHWELGHIARAQNVESDDPNTKLIWWKEEGAGTHPNILIPIRSDAVGGGQAWMDTVVNLKKLKSKRKQTWHEKYFGFLESG